MLSQTTARGLYAGKVYPSGDFTIGRIGKPPVAKRDEETHPLAGIEQDSYWHEGKNCKIIEFSDRQPQLGLSVATNSHKTRNRRGGSGITGLGKRKLRSAATIMGKEVRRELLTFGTCTIPSVTEEENELICENWSELIKQLMQEIWRILDRNGCPNRDYFYCTEIQEQRFERDGLVALHIHFVVQGRKSAWSRWAMSPDDLRRIWGRLLENLLGRAIDCKAATRVEMPRGSLAKELSKYLSKGGKILGKVKKAGKEHQLPSSYWGMYRKLSKKIDKQTAKLEGETATGFLDSLGSLSDSGHVVYRQIILENYGGICVGWVGFVKDVELLGVLLG